VAGIVTSKNTASEDADEGIEFTDAEITEYGVSVAVGFVVGQLQLIVLYRMHKKKVNAELQE